MRRTAGKACGLAPVDGAESGHEGEEQRGENGSGDRTQHRFARGERLILFNQLGNFPLQSGDASIEFGGMAFNVRGDR